MQDMERDEDQYYLMTWNAWGLRTPCSSVVILELGSTTVATMRMLESAVVL